MQKRLCKPVLSIALCLFLAGSVFFSGCSSPSQQKLTRLEGQTMGTFYQVTVAQSLPEADQQKLQQEIDSLLEEINREMSTYDPESEISQFNQSQSTEPFPVSVRFVTVVAAALNIAEQTDGAFDPTVAPLVNLWHFGADIKDRTIPTEEQILQTKAFVGYQQLSVQQEPPAITKAIPELQLDLSAIAKGFAVDEVAALLIEHGYENFLVNIGGEIQARGRKQNGQGWKLGIEKPEDGIQEAELVFELTDHAMATSGDYRNFYVIEGKKYSHTINPQTGKPVTHHLHSASVIAENCMLADAYATSIMVMGTEKALLFAEQHQLGVFLIDGEGDTFQIHQNSLFQQYAKE